MKYRIEFQDVGTTECCWYGRAESYPSPTEARRAIGAVIALGGPWASRVYRVAPVPKTAPTHPELVRLFERLKAHGVDVAFWYSDDDAEAVLFGDRIAAALPGGPIWEGFNDRPIGEIVWELNKDDLPGYPLYVVQEVSRLENGNTLIGNWSGFIRDKSQWNNVVQILEVTPDKKVVWGLREWRDPNDLGPASAIQLLDEKGNDEDGDLQR